MGIKAPTIEQLREVAQGFGFHMTDSDLESFLALMEGLLANYNVVDSLPDYLPEVRYPRSPGYLPVGEENKYGAWYRKASVKGSSRGKLGGEESRCQRQRVSRGCPHDGGCIRAGRLCPGSGRNRSHPYSGGRRGNRGQDGLRILLVFRGKPYQRHRPCAQSS